MFMHSIDALNHLIRIYKCVFISDTSGSWIWSLQFKDKLTFKLQRKDNIHPHSAATPPVVIEEETTKPDVRAPEHYGFRGLHSEKRLPGPNFNS